MNFSRGIEGIRSLNEWGWNRCSHHHVPVFFFFNDTATTEIYTLSLHDALPISARYVRLRKRAADECKPVTARAGTRAQPRDRRQRHLRDSSPAACAIAAGEESRRC